MSSVLSIDFSCSPCELTVSRIEGTEVHIVDSATCQLPLASQDSDVASLLSSDDLLTTLVELRSRKRVANDTFETATPLGMAVQETVEILTDSIKSLEPTWTSCVVVVPPDDFLSINLDLPFNDTKRLEPIVDLEVQDVVPFELDEFFIQYSVPSDNELKTSTGFKTDTPDEDKATTKGGRADMSSADSHDVHIGMLPRNTVGAILEICKQAGVEPSIITVPSTAIGAVYHIHPKLSRTNSAILFNRGDHYALAICINGIVRLEKSLIASRNIVIADGESKESALEQIFTTIRIMIASAEKKYGAKLEKIYLLGREVGTMQGNSPFHRPLEGLSFNELLGSQASNTTVAPLAAIYAHEEATSTPLSNFRSRQFSFTPKLSEFFRALLGVKKVALRVAIAFGLSLLVIYATREYYISNIADSLISQIRTVIPNFTAVDKSAIAQELMKRRQLLTDELASFGTYSTALPSTYLTKILEALPSSGTIELTSLVIKSAVIRIDGTAPALSTIEEFTQKLGAHIDLFRKLDYKPQKSSGGGFSFSIDIQLPE